MNTNLNFIFNAIDAEYQEYKKAVDNAETVIDAACIDYQMYEEIHTIISDKIVDQVLNIFHHEFNSNLMIDKNSVKQLIVSLYIASKNL